MITKRGITCVDCGLPWRSRGEEGRDEPALAPEAVRKASSALEPLLLAPRSLNTSLLLALLPASPLSALVLRYWNAVCLACSDHPQIANTKATGPPGCK